MCIYHMISEMPISYRNLFLADNRMFLTPYYHIPVLLNDFVAFRMKSPTRWLFMMGQMLTSYWDLA